MCNLFDTPDPIKIAPPPPPTIAPVQTDTDELARLRRELARQRTGRNNLVIDPATQSDPAQTGVASGPIRIPR